MKVQFDYCGCHVMVFGGTNGIHLGIAQAFAAAVQQEAVPAPTDQDSAP
ncbi:hypothetical protein [Comamonas sp. NLF-1-9]|nr:hypothetical protein [Comamonas sp. NLF-1-9]QXL83519.1 hypothetical protein KUD94_09640 [Comamonas sp. NLF-1-9]